MDLMQSQTLVTGPDGVFTTQVAPGTYRFEDVPGARLPVTRMAVVSGTQARLNLGPVPGTSSLTVRVKPTPGHALWLVPGAWSSVGNPPAELSKVHEARLRYQPTTGEVTFVGVAPGLYTLVWGSFHSATPQGPRVFSVSVPSQQVVSVE